jgi:1-acyl-sn-glycerol-3-phosphate acyltransferase
VSRAEKPPEKSAPRARARRQTGAGTKKPRSVEVSLGAKAGGRTRGLLDRLTPGVIRRIEAEIAERLERIPNRLNDYRYDPWGFQPDVLRKAMVFSTILYRYWFRVKTIGIENLPPGRVIVVGNHAGQIAIDAAMVGTAMILEAEPPRVPRGMGEFWLPTLPWFNVFMHRIGGVVGTPKNCVDLLHNEEAVSVFPEGVRGMNKLIWDRYKLQRFGLGFMRIALQADAPIVPVAIVGSEEQAPAIANLMPLARLLGMPAFPITPTWPLLGPLGLVPLPSRYAIQFGRPMRFTGDPDDEDEVIQKKVDQVKGVISLMIQDLRRKRKRIYF